MPGAVAGQLIKQVLDRLAAALLLLLVAPLMLAIAVAIKCDDGGAVLAGQTRVGRNGRPFVLLGFRSTVVDDPGRDPWVTRVGALLRRHDLDGLPQLLNVLGGRMSLVGPRPLAAREVGLFGPDARRRLLVRPGLTGVWQIRGRAELSRAEAARLDLRYVDNWSLGLDARILRATIGTVLDGR
jgi:lipopolysaccharide/colanic/teichoic acid biosynthesis glycosyltransferase